MSTIVTRAGKGSALTHNEVDANFTNLNTDKIEAAQTVTLTNKTLGSGTAITSGTINNASIGATTPSTGAFTNLSYTGTLTGGTGVINIGSGQVYKDASGNVGIGTSSPAYPLDVNGNAQIRSTNSIYFFSPNYGIRASTGLELKTADLIRFLNGSTENARIDSGGNLLVGQTSTNAAALGASLSTNDGTNQWRLSVGNAASTNAGFGLSVYSTGAAAYRFYVGMAGTIFATSTTISAISDQRFKENIRDLDTGLDAVMALKPRLYDWKQGKGADVKNARGFIAQEFEQVFPDLIDEWADPAPEGEEPYKSVRQDLIPVLVKAIQEQQSMIEELKAKVAKLESK